MGYRQRFSYSKKYNIEKELASNFEQNKNRVDWIGTLYWMTQAMSGRIGYMCYKSHLLYDLHVLCMSGFNFLHVRFSIFLWRSSH